MAIGDLVKVQINTAGTLIQRDDMHTYNNRMNDGRPGWDFNEPRSAHLQPELAIPFRNEVPSFLARWRDQVLW